MQSTKKRRITRTTKRMTLSRRGKKRGGEFQLFEQMKKNTCLTNVSCTRNRLVSLSKLIEESKTADKKNASGFMTKQSMTKQRSIFDEVNENMKKVKTIKELGSILQTIRDDYNLFDYFNDPSNKAVFIAAVNVPGITPYILQRTFDKMESTLYLRQERAEEERKRAIRLRRQARKGSIVEVPVNAV